MVRFVAGRCSVSDVAPARVGKCPVSSEACDGSVQHAGENAFSYNVPTLASASMLGVVGRLYP